jgi:hypothetical protein
MIHISNFTAGTTHFWNYLLNTSLPFHMFIIKFYIGHFFNFIVLIDFEMYHPDDGLNSVLLYFAACKL